ncbi:ras-related protein Rab-34 [Trichonephila clavipes]|nr:ras-related protein Rab-34 [Trichonephila clavipes]
MKEMNKVYQSDVDHETGDSLYSSVPVSKTLEERILNDYPLPYDSNCTPHKETHFSYKIRTACRNINIAKCDALRLTKVIVVGDVAVGKTCLVRRFCVQAFDTNYKATIGVDFEAEKFYILDVPFILQIWDTAGQEKFKCIASSYYRGAKVVILVFDFSQISSLYNISKWLDDTLKCTESPLLFLVGTKKDQTTNSAYKLTENEAKKLANAIGAEYCPVSAKTGENVERLFRRIAVLTFSENILKETTETEDVKISENFVKFNKTNSKKRKGKCISSCS